VAVSTVLLAAGGFFVQSLRHAGNVDLGFDPVNVVTTSVDVRVRDDPPGSPWSIATTSARCASRSSRAATSTLGISERRLPSSF
jgi:hypothetical protein